MQKNFYVFLVLLIGLFLFFSANAPIAKAYTAIRICQDNDSSFSTHYDTGKTPSGATASAYYEAGFDDGCETYYEDKHFTFFTCDSSMVPAGIASAGAGAADEWLAGCNNGVSHGLQSLSNKAFSYGIKAIGGVGVFSDPATLYYCDDIDSNSAVNLNYTGESADKDAYIKGCAQGFLNEIVDLTADSYGLCLDVAGVSGDRPTICTDAYDTGEEWASRMKYLLTPGAGKTSTAIDAGCVDALAKEAFDYDETPYLRGCLASYSNPKIDCPDETFPILGLSVNESFYKGCLAGIPLGLAAYEPGSGGGIVPPCDPTLPPNMPGACGVTAFEILIRNVIKYLFWIIIPIAAVMIAWGGFTIMTAAGNSERLRKGINSIAIALIGIAIMASAYLIIKFIFSVLSLGGATFS